MAVPLVKPKKANDIEIYMPEEKHDMASKENWLKIKILGNKWQFAVWFIYRCKKGRDAY